jgi:hypothetical protein
VVHVWQVTPPSPHVALLGAVTQVLPLQHPVHPEVGLQTHCPPLQASPAAHAWHLTPPVPHAADVGDV